MLVLTRRPGESIVIGNDVVVTVLEARGDQIRIGVRAPRSVQVHREEVHLEIQRANSDAVASSRQARQALAARPAPPGGGAAVDPRSGPGVRGPVPRSGNVTPSPRPQPPG